MAFQTLDVHDPKYIEISNALKRVIAHMDDDNLRQIVLADWDLKSSESIRYDQTVQLMFAIIESHGVKIDEFFEDWGIEPHNCYILPEYERREKRGVYQGFVEPFRGWIHRK